MKKGYISETIGGGRIVSHGQIADLSQGFSLPDGVPFTVYIRPKFSVSTLDTVLKVKLYQEDGFSDAPVAFNDWRLSSSARLPLTQKFSKRMTCIGAAVSLSRRAYDSLNLFVRITANKGVD